MKNKENLSDEAIASKIVTMQKEKKIDVDIDFTSFINDLYSSNLEISSLARETLLKVIEAVNEVQGRNLTESTVDKILKGTDEPTVESVLKCVEKQIKDRPKEPEEEPKEEPKEELKEETKRSEEIRKELKRSEEVNRILDRINKALAAKGLSGEDLIYLRGKKKCLEYINLYVQSNGSDGIFTFWPGQKFPESFLKYLPRNLTKLDLSFNENTTDIWFKEIVKLLPNLTDLSLWHAKNITDAGLKEIVNLRNLTDLNLLSTNVTKFGIEKFKKDRPDVEVRYSDYY